MRNRVISTALLLLVSASAALAQGARGYYREPALSGDTLIFCAEGDLWTVGVQGGLARRLTTHPGDESNPVIAPDRKTLAFSAAYEGPAEVYTMPIAGGLPVRRTYESESSVPVGWTPDGQLLYTTSHYSTLPDSQLISIDLAGGGLTRIPLSQASDGVYDDRGTLFFARPAWHRNNTKRYQGGTARNIWRFTPGDTEASNLTGDFPGEDHSPMWWKGRVYYVCDRDGTMNIWSMNPRGGDRRQHTHHAGWDVRDPAMDAGRIVYQVGADLRLYDIGSGRDREIPVTLASDFDQLREKWIKDPMNYLTSVHPHPKGDSLVLTARGRLFVAPAGSGRFVRASDKPGVRYRDAVFMPDGKTLLTLSDESGETEFHSIAANGLGPDRALTSDASVLRWQGYPSPDGAHVAYSDINEDLWLLDVATGTQDKLSTNREGVGEPTWSPDSRWLVFTQAAANTFVQIHLYKIEDGTAAILTSDRVNSRSPSWDPAGKFLYFLSDRNLVSSVGAPWGPRAPEPYFDKVWKIYEMALKKGVESPFQPPDELTPRATGEKEKREDGAVRVEIDLDGLRRRVREVPVAPGNYSSLAATKQALFFASRDGRGPGDLAAVKIEPPEGRQLKVVTVVEGIRAFELSADGKRMMVRRGDNLYVLDARPQKASDLQEHQVDLRGWSFPIDTRQDLRQIFVDAWRLERDYFYDTGMHGLDWDAVRDKYLPLVERVTSREELNDLIAQMVSELSALHVSVRGGDLRDGDDNVAVADLGARLVRDEAAGGYRVDYIYQSDPDYPDDLSPLAAPGVELSAGDLIEAINGTRLLSVPHPAVLLRNQQGRQIVLDVRPGSGGEPRRVVVTPTRGGQNLRYSDWEYTRRLEVESKSDDSLGYLHLRAMGGGSLTEFYRNYYPVFNRKGLIVDVRHNNGGNTDSLILSKLMRQAWFYWSGRVGEPYWNMQYAFRGPMVVLVDERTASDGEAFAEGFRRLGLGKVIGSRTWGGEIWLSSNNRLTDGGLARAPQNGVYGPERKWLIEGWGVVPDIEVDNLPLETFQGKDAQLEAAIQYLMEEIRKNPNPVPPPPPRPDKTFTPVQAGSGGGR